MPEATSPRPRLLFVEDDAVLREHLAQKLSDQYVVTQQVTATKHFWR